MLNELNNIVTFLNNYIWGIGMLVLGAGCRKRTLFYNQTAWFPICTFQGYVEQNY